MLLTSSAPARHESTIDDFNQRLLAQDLHPPVTRDFLSTINFGSPQDLQVVPPVPESTTTSNQNGKKLKLAPLLPTSSPAPQKKKVYPYMPDQLYQLRRKKYEFLRDWKAFLE
jgi:hypothetical protein